MRSRSFTPSRALNSPMIRDTEGWDRFMSWAARVKLPLSPTRTKTVNYLEPIIHLKIG